jgi:hypothetical protein
MTPGRCAGVLAAVLALAACKTIAPEEAQLSHFKDLQQAGQLEKLAAEPTPCNRPAADVCAQAQQIRADACMSLARQKPADPDRRIWLDCAVAGFSAAASSLPANADPERQTLLQRNLAAAALDRLDMGGPPGDLDVQLQAADALLARDPHDPSGCYHERSARLSRALALPRGTTRCKELSAIPISCAAVAAPPDAPTQSRQLVAQIGRQKLENACR